VLLMATRAATEPGSITSTARTLCRHYLDLLTASASQWKPALELVTAFRLDWEFVQRRRVRSGMQVGQIREDFFALEVKASKIRCAKVKAWIQLLLFIF